MIVRDDVSVGIDNHAGCFPFGLRLEFAEEIITAANLALLAMTTRDTGRSRAAALTAGGLLGQIASLAITARYELPINSGVLTWSSTTPPPGWQTARDRWDAFHTVRTATSVAALACLTAAVLGDPPRSQP